ncbi:MAG: GWxTD domain-containing protein [Acidobacteriota bacterium]|nr:MAG: GWxTD domain-containing protein [Acidobacteriota bacterium]
MVLLWVALFIQASTVGQVPLNPDLWLRDVTYIISSQEKENFKALTSDVERALFVEEFWKSRDADPSTERNEFREVYLDRVAIAHKRFPPLSDRARVFVLNGEPDQRLVYPEMKFDEPLPQANADRAGGNRGQSETSSSLRAGDASFPTINIESPEAELWTYFNARGSSRVAGPYELIFMRIPPGELSTLYAVPHMLNRLNLARMLANTPLFRGSRTFPVEHTLVYAGDPRFHGIRDFYHEMLNNNRSFDTLEIWRSMNEVRRSSGDLAEAERHRKLKEVVDSSLYFDTLEASVDYWYFRAAGEFVYVPLSIHVPGDELDGVTELSILAEVMEGEKIVARFADEVSLDSREDRSLSREGLLYESRFAIRPGEYRLMVNVLDRDNGRHRRIDLPLAVPDLGQTGFSLSNLVLCNDVADRDEVRKKSGVEYAREWLTYSDLNPLSADGLMLKPAPARQFRRKDLLTVFFEVYLPELEDSKPNVDVAITVHQNGQEISRIKVENLRYLTEDQLSKISFAQSLSLSRLRPGRYELQVEARDLISGRQAVGLETFEVL